MGMDIHGKSGNYFRANIWSWRPIHYVCAQVVEEEGLDISLEGWTFNEGDGIQNDKTKCELLAAGIESWIDRQALDQAATVDAEGIINLPEREIKLDAAQVGQTPESVVLGLSGGELASEYSTHVDHLREFVTFLRDCGGGFGIW